ncbi:MAG: DUF1003 domain-containing protein [Bryobacterales bacterium]|nr:DUF1003 domain-containing protein [Bryobacterales bacterium]
MPCDPELLRHVNLFALLDDEERAVLAAHVELRSFAMGQVIYLRGQPGGRGYVVVQGNVEVATVDEDDQELILAETGPGGFFGFASLLNGSSHQTTARAIAPSECVEIDHEDLSQLVRRKPDAGLDMLTTISRQIHAVQEVARSRSLRNPNEVIAQEETFGDHVADAVARFGGSWNFIIFFTILLSIYVLVNLELREAAWDPYPYILLNLFLSMLAALQAPVIMMSQNRQDAKDRLRAELDFGVNRRAEQEVRVISKKLSSVELQLEAIADLVSHPPHRTERESSPGPGSPS